MTDSPPVPKRIRLGWDEFWIHMADAYSVRSTCDRGRSGCVIVYNNQILTAGYVGSPPGEPHCDDIGHDFYDYTDKNGNVSQRCKRTIHAEKNAILQAESRRVLISGTTLYCRMTPCIEICAPAIVKHGIIRVVCERKYRFGDETEALFLKEGIKLKYIHNEIQKYAGEK